jgi:hypothetical protein
MFAPVKGSKGLPLAGFGAAPKPFLLPYDAQFARNSPYSVTPPQACSVCPVM